MKKNLKENYTPLYFLSSLGAGGLSVSFFMYLQFMLPHKTPIFTFADLTNILDKAHGLSKTLVYLSLVGIIVFGIIHFFLLAWNLREFALFRKTEPFKKMQTSSGAMALMAVPLTLAMTLNVLLIFGAVFLPNLWPNIEAFFLPSIIGFLLVGILSLHYFGKYTVWAVINGDASFVNSNNLGHMLSIFTFAMISVGFAASGAMSHNIVINGAGIFFAIMFLFMAFIVAMVKYVLGFKAILEKGISIEASPSLWITIPFLTLSGITMIRLFFGLGHHFDSEISYSIVFVITASIIAIQVLTGLFGYVVMHKNGYFKEYVKGQGKSVGSLSLICPGVAFFVFGMFFVHFGIVKNEIFEKASIGYFILLAPFVLVQIRTVIAYFRLGKKLLF